MQWKKVTHETEFDTDKTYLICNMLSDETWAVYFLMEYNSIFMVWNLSNETRITKTISSYLTRFPESFYYLEVSPPILDSKIKQGR